VKVKYILNDRYPIPATLVWLMASGGISLALFTGLGIGFWIIWGEPNHNLLDAFPGWVSLLFGIWGAYTGIGAMLIWIAMWVYWAVVEGTSSRVTWFLILFFGTYYGALIYAFVLWRKGAISVVPESPVSNNVGVLKSRL
jgi:hypothetical protein